MALYDAAGGANWRQNANWGGDRPLGEWHGVTTNEAGRVTHLDLSFNGLVGRLPPELGALTYLEDLDLSYTYGTLTGPIPAELGNLANLEVLDLGINGLTGPIPASLGALAKLRRLSLAVNALTGPIPRPWPPCPTSGA